MGIPFAPRASDNANEFKCRQLKMYTHKLIPDFDFLMLIMILFN